MDLYNPHESQRVLRFCFLDIDRKKFGAKLYLQPGWNRARFSIDAMRDKGLKTQQMNTIWILLHVPEQQTTVYVDNIHLEDLTPARTAQVRGQLDVLRRCAAWLKTDEGKTLSARVKTLSEKLASQKDNPEAVLAVQEECAELLNRYRDQITAVLFDTGVGLYPAQPVRYSAVPLVNGKPVSTPFAPANPAVVSGRFDLLGKHQSLLRRLREMDPGPLVVGVDNEVDPAELVYRPQVFDKSLGGKVKFAAAGGEAESACLMLIPTAGPLAEVTWSAGPLRLVGSEGDTIPAETVEVQPLGCRKPSPLEPARPWILRHDIQQVDIPADVQQALWVTVRVPRDARPGQYTGEIIVRAKGVEPVTVPVECTVWPFTLPETIYIPMVCNYNESEQADALVLAYRVNPSGIYEWPGPPKIEDIRRWVKSGARDINLMRISKFALKSSFVRDENGRMTVADTNLKRKIFERLGKIVPQLKKEGLLQYCYVYGFDEPGAGLITAMEDIYGEIREEFGLKTMFCTLNPIWEQYPKIHNVDRWSVQANYLTPARAEAIRKQGIEVWSHNQAQGFPVGRMQFWSAYRLGLDGLLQYGLRSGGWSTDPKAFPIEEGPLGGVMLRVDNKKQRYEDTTGYATLEFAQWRDGSEDVEYLVILRNLVEQMRARKADLTDAQRKMLSEAEYWLSVPDTVAPPYHDRATPAWRPLTRTEISNLRSRIAALIIQFQNELAQ